MAYVGNTPTTQSFISGTDYFNGNGSTVAFTLSRAVVSVNDIEVVINNVVQQPNTAYTISGTTITFTSAPSAGTSNIYVRYLSTTTQSITPSQGTVSYSTLNSDNQSKLGISFKNRIINGAAAIDQRYAGVLQTSIGNNSFITDRFSYQRAGLGITAVFNSQQSSTTIAPFSYSNYLTATTGQTLGATGGTYMMIRHAIEGYNIADALRNQSTITLSFWVNFSNSGTYSLVLANGVAGDRSYATTYSVTAANTWQQITLLIPLTASGGTWNYTNGVGLDIRFVLDCADDTCTSSNNAWVNSNSYGAAGQSHGKVTTGATFYITGVQLEVGTQATTFDYRSYGTELQLCQRYCWSSYTASGNGGPLGTGAVYNATLTQVAMQLPVSMRTTPSATTVLNGSSVWCTSYVGASGTSTALAPSIQTDSYNYQNLRIAVDGLSGMTAGQASWTFTSANAKLILSAEL